jgi:hypothetical protein
MTTRRAGTGSTLTPYHQPHTARHDHFTYLTKRERIENHVGFGSIQSRYETVRVSGSQQQQGAPHQTTEPVLQPGNVEGAGSDRTGRASGTAQQTAKNADAVSHNGQNAELKHQRAGAYAYLSPQRQAQYDQYMACGFGFRWELQEIEAAYAASKPYVVELFKRFCCTRYFDDDGHEIVRG